MSPDTLLSVLFYLLAHSGCALIGPREGPGSVLEFLIAATTALSYLVLLPLVLAGMRGGSQKKEDSEAVMRHFLPF